MIHLPAAILLLCVLSLGASGLILSVVRCTGAPWRQALLNTAAILMGATAAFVGLTVWLAAK